MPIYSLYYWDAMSVLGGAVQHVPAEGWTLSWTVCFIVSTSRGCRGEAPPTAASTATMKVNLRLYCKVTMQKFRFALFCSTDHHRDCSGMTLRMTFTPYVWKERKVWLCLLRRRDGLMDGLQIENRRLSLGKQQEISFQVIKVYFQRESGSFSLSVNELNNFLSIVFWIGPTPIYQLLAWKIPCFLFICYYLL